MHHLRFVIFGLTAGLTAVGLAQILELSSVSSIGMFGGGMIYGSLAQLAAGRFLKDNVPPVQRSPYHRVSESPDPPPLEDTVSSH